MKSIEAKKFIDENIQNAYSKSKEIAEKAVEIAEKNLMEYAIKVHCHWCDRNKNRDGICYDCGDIFPCEYENCEFVKEDFIDRINKYYEKHI